MRTLIVCLVLLIGTTCQAQDMSGLVKAWRGYEAAAIWDTIYHYGEMGYEQDMDPDQYRAMKAKWRGAFPLDEFITVRLVANKKRDFLGFIEWLERRGAKNK